MEDVTWECRVCGEERPDVNTSVFVREQSGMRQTYVYCNDKPKCAAGVQKLKYLIIVRDADGDPVGFHWEQP